jgi:hypothetical protein
LNGGSYLTADNCTPKITKLTPLRAGEYTDWLRNILSAYSKWNQTPTPKQSPNLNSIETKLLLIKAY